MEASVEQQWQAIEGNIPKHPENQALYDRIQSIAPMRWHIEQAIERGAAYSSTLTGESTVSDAAIQRAEVALAAVAGLPYMQAKAALQLASEALGTAATVALPPPGLDQKLVVEVVLGAVRKAG